MAQDPRPPLLVIAGPTASGKSALALAIAERHDGIIVNADASQVYADLRVVTARPCPEEEARAPHRLFGHIDANDAGYSAVRWAVEAREAIAHTHAAGRLPILVGGTGLYLRTLINGIAPVPPIDRAIRAAVRAMPVTQARAELARLDPAGAALLHANDTTRVARALEVVRSTGRPLADWQRERAGGIAGQVRLTAAVLLPPRDWLAERIDRRSVEIVRDGVGEVAALLTRRDVPPDAPILRAIGVPETTRLVRGQIDAVEAARALALSTRRYAKRQYTWFRHQPPPDWRRIDVATNAELTSRVGALLRISRA